MNNQFRPAERSDSPMAVKLLATTTGEFGVSTLGLGSPKLQFAALQKWFCSPGNRFSYQVSLISQQESKITGLLVRFSGSRLASLELGCIKQMIPIYGLLGAVKMIRRNKLLASAKEAERDEYYISHLAVDTEFRRQGIAQELINRAIEETQREKLDRLVLSVEIDNSPAIQLYLKMGFRIVDTKEFKELSPGVKSPGFHKMLRIV
ncbi:MAG: GNAT family N-acetyltransferase [Chloroflexi bacterium]|nr:GNAT family N-acetyltransferase [Chloroflexota bacterium]